MSKKVLILGSNGFIGRNIKQYLENDQENYDIFSPSSLELDISDEEAVKDYIKNRYFDVILHAAVYNPRVGNNKHIEKEIDMNLRMFYNFEKYNDYYGKMLYFGSGAEFDKREDISMAKEDFNRNGIPVSDYGLYKYIINKAIESSRNIHNLRIFGLFGKYENWKSTFISGACCKASKNLPITIRQNVYFDYLYIDDFCKIVEWFIKNDLEHKVYNVSSGKKIDLLTIAEIVRKISGKTDIPIYICNEGLGNEYTADNTRLMKEINGFDFTKIEDAIKDLYSWYSKNEDMIDIYSLLYQ